jgi:Cu(I)/Ag(I) efflux system membrane protein CusA/SilA
LPDVARSVRDANSEIGARVLESAGREYVLRGRGYVKTLEDLEKSAVALGPGDTPIRLADVATVRFGSDIRRGAADFNGKGEAAGGIVVMRIGSNALEVNEGIRERIENLALPEGVRIVPTYDRSGLIRHEHENPVARFLIRIYLPVARLVVRARLLVVALSLVALGATVPVYLSIGSEFMPPLDEGSLLVMPATFPGISIEEARRTLIAQDRIILSFPEVETVHGKTGRAETATDPAQLEMIETVVTFKARDEWPTHPVQRWYSSWAPEWSKRPLRAIWPDRSARTQEEVTKELAKALETPGFQTAIAPPIRTRIDMLTTGVRTPVGLKVLGDDLGEIERISIALEGILRDVPGTRSIFAERQSGREYVDVTPNRDVLARYGLTVRDVNDVVEMAVGGMPLSTVISGRSRFTINLR